MPYLFMLTDPEPATTVTGALTDALETVAGDMTGMITSILPVALGVVGAVLVVTFGIKLFKKITGR